MSGGMSDTWVDVGGEEVELNVDEVEVARRPKFAFDARLLARRLRNTRRTPSRGPPVANF